MPFALLLAMQAAGMVTDYMGVKSNQKWADMGTKLQNVGIEANIEQTRLETEDASLNAMKNLRQNIGAQIAVFAARGTNTGQGNPVSIMNESINNFNSDERMRRLNLIGRENDLRGGQTIANINQQAGNAKLWQGFSSRTFNRFPSSYAGWKQGLTDLSNSLSSIGNSLSSIGSR